MIKRAAVVGAAAWTAPVIIGSIASPAGAGTQSHCNLYVVLLKSPGNSAGCDVTLSASTACATTVIGPSPTCIDYTRATANPAPDVGTVTLACAGYNDTLDQFGFTATVVNSNCKIVGVAQTNGTGNATACAGSLTLATVTPTSTHVFTVPSVDVNNTQAWVYFAVRCN